METSWFFARAWGLLLTIIPLAFLVNKKNLQTVFRAIEDDIFILFSGFIALFIGIPTVLLHTVWMPDWRGLITLFGWLALFKGIIRLFYPDLVRQWAKKLKDSSLMPGILWTVFFLGLTLSYVGFIAL